MKTKRKISFYLNIFSYVLSIVLLSVLVYISYQDYIGNLDNITAANFQKFALFYIPIILILAKIISYFKSREIDFTENSVVITKVRKIKKWHIGIIGVLLIFFVLLTFNQSNYFSINMLLIYVLIILFTAVYLILHFNTPSRRQLFISSDGINTVDEKKHRKLAEITSLEIKPNYIEFRFNELEILRIEKETLEYPDWQVFTDKIGSIKTRFE